jgi:hypothetical protein
MISQRPAQLNRVSGVLTPPTISVRFDRTQQSDDGQLTGYLTRKLGLDKEVALAAVNDFRKDIEDKLNSSQTVSMEGFGTLSKKATGEITFTGDEDLLKRISLFEMPRIEVPRPANIKAESTQSTVRSETKISEKAPVPVRTKTEYRGNRKWIIPVVLLGLLLGMLVVIYFTGNMSVLVSDIKSIFISESKDSTRQLVFGNAATDTTKITDTLTTQISKELDKQVDRSKALSIDVPERAADNKRTVVPDRTAPEEKPNYARPYHIVAGSFTVLENAEKQRSTLLAKGLDAEILPKKGKFYMVSLGSFDTPGEASSEKNIMQRVAGFELWVMRNK